MSRAPSCPKRLLPIVIFGVLCLARPAAAAKIVDPRTLPPPQFDLGRDSIAVRTRLAHVEAAEVSRACGNISFPWAYRGPRGRSMAMRRFGRRSAGQEWASRFAAHLLAMAPLNPAIRMSPTQAACDANAPRPVYLVMLRSGAQQTFVVLRFDVDEAVLFDGETPLGMLPLGSRADSLWLALGERLDDDPPLRSPPPPLELEPPEVGFGDSTYVEELPDVLERVAPSYPESARKQSIEGVVWVMAKVGKDGDVHDAIVQAGPRELRDDALDAVWQWKFRPAKRKGEPIVVWVMVPVSFRLH